MIVASPINETSPLKRHRRTKDDVGRLLESAVKILDEYPQAITIRHLFYRMVGAGCIAKTEEAYKNLCAHLTRWRRSEEIPWGWFVDGSRTYYGPTLFNSMDEALARTAETYRRDLWARQPYYCELWIEKDAIRGLVQSTASSFGLRTFPCRGFPSLSALYEASTTYNQAIGAGKIPTILYLGDHDPSGTAIDQSIEDTLTNDFGVEGIVFDRLAVLPEQIEKYSLPTRPTKASDTRAARWSGSECVEVDAMMPSTLVELVTNAILSRIDARQWEMTKAIEREEKTTLEAYMSAFKGAGS